MRELSRFDDPDIERGVYNNTQSDDEYLTKINKIEKMDTSIKTCLLPPNYHRWEVFEGLRKTTLLKFDWILTHLQINQLVAYNHEPMKMSLACELECFRLANCEVSQTYISKVCRLLFYLRTYKEKEWILQKIRQHDFEPIHLLTLNFHQLTPHPIVETYLLLGQPVGFSYCKFCKKDAASFFEFQVRSADEPMTCFYTCGNCGKHWKT
jgi:hypothetical protein